MEKKTCPKCGSRHWIESLPVTNQYSGNRTNPCVYVDLNWMGSHIGESTFTASVCGDCGYTEFYAERPQVILEEWRKRNA